MVIEKALQQFALRPVNRNEIRDGVAQHRAVAEFQLGFRRHRNTRPRQRVGISRQLQQRGDLGRAGQLGVGHPILVAVADQEVGEPDETAVEHRRLIHHRGAVGDGAAGGLGGGSQPGRRVGRAADNGDLVAELVAQLLEPASFMLGAENAGASEQFVVGDDGGAPAQLRVEIPQQRVLAAGGGGKIRRAVDDAVSGDEHSSHCREGDRHT